MKYRSASSVFVLDDPQADRKASIRLGQYRVGPKALWLPAFPVDRYIPFDAIECVWQRPSEIHPTGCCGRGIPVVRVIIRYDAGSGEHPEVCYVMDDQPQADRLIDIINSTRPGVVCENGRTENRRQSSC